MKFDAEWGSTICKTTNDFSSFGVPQLNSSVIASWEESLTIISKANIPYSLRMTHIRSNAFTVCHHIPNFTSTVMTRAQHEVACLRKELHSLDSFVVPTKSMQPFFWYEAIVLLLTQIAGCLDKTFKHSCIHILWVSVINSSCLVH